MKVLRDEWVILFHSTKDCVPSDTSISTIFCDSKTIIDDTLIFSNHIPTLLHYFSCVAQVFTKYRFSFKLSKCDFFLSRIEYGGHDLIADGNCLVQSKFVLIRQWPLPPHGVSLLSLVFILQQLCSMVWITHKTSSSSTTFASSPNSTATYMVTSAYWRFQKLQDESNNLVPSPSIR